MKSDNTMQNVIAIVGAGPAGCMAAISAAKHGTHVVLLDKNPMIGRKIYATGNGRCNITNFFQNEHCYFSSSQSGSPLLNYFGSDSFEILPKEICSFFEKYGIFFHDRNGYVYPRTDQAATVCEAFEKILTSLSVEIILNAEVSEINYMGDRAEQFEISYLHSFYSEKGGKSGKRKLLSKEQSTLRADRIILCTGGLAGPQYGCSGDGYHFAENIGHSIIPPLPALVQLTSADPALRSAAGVRCEASCCLINADEILQRETGEVQFTQDTVSGIPVFQLSGTAVRILDTGKSGDLKIRFDFLPEFDDSKWAEEVQRRLSEPMNQTLGNLFVGLCNRKILNMILQRFDMQAENKASKALLKNPDCILEILSVLRNFEISVSGFKGFENAQTTSGGIDLSEVNTDFSSCKQSGLYFAGELLDINGLCGGYNLTWALLSGKRAGESAANDLLQE